MEDEVARPFRRILLHLGRIVRRQFSRILVEPELVDGVRRVRVRHKGEAIGAIRLNAVRVALRLDPLQRLFRQRAVLSDPMHRNVPRSVVGGQQVAIRIVRPHVRRTVLQIHGPDRGELARLPVDRVAAELLFRPQGDKHQRLGRVRPRGAGRPLQFDILLCGELAGLLIHQKMRQPLAAGVGNVHVIGHDLSSVVVGNISIIHSDRAAVGNLRATDRPRRTSPRSVPLRSG